MTAESMVEKVARAICAAQGVGPDEPLASFESDIGRREQPAWQLYRYEARAAIEAMKYPTPEMLKASGEANKLRAAQRFADMIDAALSEPSP